MTSSLFRPEALGFALVAALTVAVTWLRSLIVVILQNTLHFAFGARLFRHLIRLPLSFFEKRHIGDVLSRFTSIEPVRVAWLDAELARDAMRPQWQPFWGVTRRAYGPDHSLAEDPMPILRAKTKVRHGSIFDIPERAWDAATMFFCAESITQRQDEFERACAAYARSVKPGGALIAAFLVRSGGYVVADRPFPALNLSIETIEEVFSRHVDKMKAEQIGIREWEIRSGYSGFVFLTGIIH
jgi:ABC transporter transmembrane region/NNMT/PNMT/TEMT family